MRHNAQEILPEAKSAPHDSAHLHVVGASTYVDDRPFMKNELVVALIFSPHAKAQIKAIHKKVSIADVTVLTAADLHHNLWGGIFADQPLLAEAEVNHVGEVVAIVAAPSLEKIKAALKEISIDYDVKKPILSIDEALKEKSFIGFEKIFKRGHVDDDMARAPHRLQAQFELKGADHFYLENQSVIAYPEDDGRIVVHSSTQHPTETQAVVAEALGLPLSFVICVAERLGGGFGGKETQSAPFAAYAALVAQKTKRPARLVLSKDDDMIITGKRNPYRVSYDVGFADDGAIIAFDAQFYGDGGAYADLSTAILERAMAHVDNAYFLPSVRIKGQVLRTNYHSHTAFRGFGGPKGVALIEHMMDDIAHYLRVDALDVRVRNCYRGHNNITPYGQVVENNLLPDIIENLAEKCEYRARRLALDEWNSDPKNKPRGLALTPIKFGICFTTRFLNQGNALVHIFRDGSVQVATGATEMGQGVQTRIRTVVANAFGISELMVRILPTATDKNANTSPTAASSGTDLNGSAALIACEELKDRLSRLLLAIVEQPRDLWPDKTAGPGTMLEKELASLKKADAVFADGFVHVPQFPDRKVAFAVLVNNAYLSRFAMSAYGYYRVPRVNFNKVTSTGQPFLYFTQGAAVSEIEIDPMTGEVKCLRTDILMDAGKPINYALDKGQIIGGFMQGLGYMLTEKLFYDERGKLLTHAPSTYKIPSIHDMPRILNVELMKNDDNHKNLCGTKALGEPPLMLCFSVWNAVKDALRYRNDVNQRLPALPVPATAEVVLMHLR